MTEDNELTTARDVMLSRMGRAVFRPCDNTDYTSDEFPDGAVIATAMGWANRERAEHDLPPITWWELRRGEQTLLYRRASAALTAYRNHQVAL